MEEYSENKSALTPEERAARRKRKKKRRILKKIGLGFKLFFLDILLTAVFICTFALFHHVIPKLTQTVVTLPAGSAAAAESTAVPETAGNDAAAEENTEEQSEETGSAEAVSEEIPENEDNTENTEEQVTAEPEVTPEPEPVDTRTEWQKKFAEYFTDEVVVTDDSYTSPNVAVTITKVTKTYGEDWNDYPVIYYVADIHIADIDCIKTGAAGGDMSANSVADAATLDILNSAIIQINGDTATSNYGFVVRNGKVYSAQQTEEDIAVLYYDGTFRTYAADEYNVDDILAQNPYQVWKFGPELLDDNGLPLESFNSTLTTWHPRTAIGYYEPGHYCFLVAEGRTSTSRGLQMDALAQILSDLGCVAAYNLDGGASTVMTFNDKLVNVQCSYRQIEDTIYIADITDEES